MRGLISFILAGVAVVVALDALAPPAGPGLAVGAWPKLEENPAAQVVDRTHKGDRLRVPAVNSRQQPQPKAPATLIGCEPVFSSLSASSRANFVGRCIA